MTETRNGSVTLDLTRKEAWVLHAAVVAEMDREVEAGRTPSREIELLERVEVDGQFDETDLELAERALAAHLDGAPPRDRDPGRAALDSVRTARA